MTWYFLYNIIISKPAHFINNVNEARKFAVVRNTKNKTKNKN
jgi:hypothetical protein